MSKCLVFVLCAVSLITFVFCAPGSENIRENQSTRQDVTDQLNGASRTKRQSSGTIEVVYLDAASLNPTKLKDLQSKESARLVPVNDAIDPGQSYQQIPDYNLELVSQNSNYAVYKLKSGDDPLNDLPDGQKAQAYYDRPIMPLKGGPARPHHAPPPDYGRPPPPHHRGPPPDYGRPHHGGPPDRYDDRPPHHHGGPPHRYDDRPRHHHGGPPDRYDDRPPHHHGGPPDRYDDRPPHHHGGPPDRRPPPPRDGPDRFDNRPPYRQTPPPPPHGIRPPPNQDPFDQGNDNNEHSQNDNNSGEVMDGTQTSSTTEAETDDDQYQLDVRFSDDDRKGAETMKRDVSSRKTPAPLFSHLSPFIFQAAAVKPED